MKRQQPIGYFLCLLLALSFIGCEDNNDDVNTPTFRDIDIVTGLDMTDALGAPIGRWKFTNNKAGEVSVFPNPSDGNVSLFSTEGIARVMLIPATCLNDSTTVDIPGQSQMLDFSLEEIEALQVKDFQVLVDANEIILDYTDVSAGFYRVFYQIGNEFFWQNIYIDPAVNNFPNLDFLQGLCE